MLYGFILIVHVLVSLFLIAVILLQGGRGGMGEALSGTAAQSLFGGGVNTVMTKITSVCAGLFMVTCLSLAALSTARGRSVIDQFPTTPDQLPIALPQSTEERRDAQPPAPASSAQPSPSQPSAAPSEPGAGPVPAEATQ